MSFDPEQFVQSLETNEAGATEYMPIPASTDPRCGGQDYLGQCTKVEARQIHSDKNGGQDFLVLELTYELSHPTMNLAEITGRDKNFARHAIFLELKADGKTLDMGKGKNVPLNRIRDMYGQNVSGQHWSPLKLLNTMALCVVEHRPNEKNPEGAPFAQITQIKKV